VIFTPTATEFEFNAMHEYPLHRQLAEALIRDKLVSVIVLCDSLEENPREDPVYVEHKRRYSGMPAPFHYWDSRNSFQQFYFVEQEAGLVDFCFGGTAGSSTREVHGRFAHAFAVVDQTTSIPTHVWRYTGDNRFEHVVSYPNFHVVDQDLTGDHQKISKLLGPRLLKLIFEEQGKTLLSPRNI